VIEQVPAATGVTLVEETVHTDPELLVRVTVKPDEALAVSDCGLSVAIMEFG
jgi:hypothetical protein